MNNELEQLIKAIILDKGFTKINSTVRAAGFDQIFEALNDGGYAHEAHMTAEQVRERMLHLTEVVFNLNPVSNAFCVTPVYNARVSGAMISAQEFLTDVDEARETVNTSNDGITALVLVTSSLVERNAIISEAFANGFSHGPFSCEWFRNQEPLWSVIKLSHTPDGKNTIDLARTEQDARLGLGAKPNDVLTISNGLSDLKRVVDAMAAVREAKTVPELPEINNYDGEYEKDENTVRYGCATIDLGLIHAITDHYEGNRQIRAVTLGSGVEITRSEAEEILEHVDAVNG